MNLSHPDCRERLDRLAGEYALGTSPPRVRRRLAAIANSDRVVADALRQWELRLAPLAAAVPGITPAPRVWARIASSLGIEMRPPPAAPAPAPWWQRLALWRALTIASAVIAVALGIAKFAQPPGPDVAPIVVVLAGADAKPALIATASRLNRYLTIKPVGNTAPAAGQVFELWALPQASPPKSLGVIPAGRVVQVPLTAPADEALTNIPALAVSLEPPGGSPTGQPTGPVLYSGTIERMF